MFGLIGTAIRLTNKSTSNNETKNKTEGTPNNLFYQYSDIDNIFSWNLYNGKQASFDSTENGYLYYVFNNEDVNNNQNLLIISMGEFSFDFSNDLKFSSVVSNGKTVEEELDLGCDLRNNWNTNNTNYQNSDITNKYNIERKVTLNTSRTDKYNRTEYYKDEYYSAYMDVYVNSNNDIVYALPGDIGKISYVTKDERNTDAVQQNETLLEGNKVSNMSNLMDSLGEPNYAICTNDSEAAKLTYVWYVFDNYYFYYTMRVRYYMDSMLPGGDQIESSLTGTSITDFEYGIVNKDYIYYTNNELARLFAAKEQEDSLETWISIDE